MDVERVEVLRGPQGTLYGRDATGGVVNIIMVQPKDIFESQAKVQIGSYDARSYQAVVNVPVNSKLAFRVSGSLDKTDSHYTGYDWGKQETKAARLKAQWKPSEDITLSAGGEYNLEKQIGGGFILIPSANLSSNDPWHYTPSSTPMGVGGINMVTTCNYNMNLNWKIKDLTVLTVIPTYQTVSYESISSGSQSQSPGGFPESKQYTLETRFANPADSKVTWTVGGYMLKSKSSETSAALSNLREGVNFIYPERPNKSYAIFGQTTYPFTESLRVVAGGRYNKDNKAMKYRIITCDADLNILSQAGFLDAGKTDSKPTFKVGLEYDVAKNSMAYLQASSGYKSDGVSQAPDNASLDASGHLVQTGMNYKAETSLAYELGSKNRFMDGRLQVNGDIYLTAYKNMQVQTQIPLAIVGTTDVQYLMGVANAGPSNIYGAELETTWLLAENDLLTINMSSDNGKYHDLMLTSKGGGPTLTIYEKFNVDGQTMAHISKFNMNIDYSHTFEIGEYGTLVPSLDIKYKTKSYNTVEVSVAGAEVPAYHMSNFYLNWASPKGMWKANAYVKNIENKAIANMAFPANGPGMGKDSVTLSAPRTYGASLSIKY